MGIATIHRAVLRKNFSIKISKSSKSFRIKLVAPRPIWQTRCDRIPRHSGFHHVTTWHEAKSVFFAGALPNCGIECLHPESVLSLEFSTLFRVGMETITLSEEPRLKVREVIVRNWFEELVEARELWNLRLSNWSNLPHGAGLRWHRADAEPCCYGVDCCPRHAAVGHGDGDSRGIQNRRILVVRILVRSERVRVATRPIASDNPQITKGVSNLSDRVGRECRQTRWVTNGDAGAGIVQSCQRNDRCLSPHTVLEILVLLPLNFRKTPPLCVRYENISANFDDSIRLRHLS